MKKIEDFETYFEEHLQKSTESCFPSDIPEEQPDLPGNEPEDTTYDDPFYARQSGTLSGNDRKYGEA